MPVFRFKITRRALTLLAALPLSGVAPAVSACEEPSYTTHREYEGFELRRYATRLVVETRVAGDFYQARHEAFGRLFACISGNNNAGSTVTMTVPVTSNPEGDRIGMAVPVTSDTTGRAHHMQFFVPSACATEAGADGRSRATIHAEPHPAADAGPLSPCVRS
jgi:hypothetical protein